MRWNFWCSPVFALASVAAFIGAAQSQPAILADLSQPKNFAQAMDRSRQLEQLGHDLFFEKALSGSGKMSCASCHDPDHDFTPDNNLAVQLGGEKLDQPGNRSVPTLKYLQATPPFEEHHFATEDD